MYAVIKNSKGEFQTLEITVSIWETEANIKSNETLIAICEHQTGALMTQIRSEKEDKIRRWAKSSDEWDQVYEMKKICEALGENFFLYLSSKVHDYNEIADTAHLCSVRKIWSLNEMLVIGYEWLGLSTKDTWEFWRKWKDEELHVRNLVKEMAKEFGMRTSYSEEE